MIRYSYNRQMVSPAPIIILTVRCPETGKEVKDFPAQLDTGADRTVLGGSLVDSLELVPLDEIPIGGFGGHISLIPTYLVEFAIHQLPPVKIEAIAHPDEPVILLGRDVLNNYRLVLDGPKLVLEIS
jgi:hypothetical protein